MRKGVRPAKPVMPNQGTATLCPYKYFFVVFVFFVVRT